MATRAPARVHTTTTALSTGITLSYAETGDPAGEPLVFLHGFPDSAYSFSLVLEGVSDRFHAFALDQRGFGESSRPESGYGIHAFAADVAAFLDAHGLRDATIVGHSFGSFVAQRVALDFPHRVNRLVLVGSAATTLRNPAVRAVGAGVRALHDPIDRAFVTGFQTSTTNGVLPPGFLDAVVDESLKAPARVWKDVLATLARIDHRTELPRISAPVLVVWGDRDAVFCRSDQDELLSLLRNVTFRPLAGAGHSPNWDHPAELTAAIEAFLRDN